MNIKQALRIFGRETRIEIETCDGEVQAYTPSLDGIENCLPQDCDPDSLRLAWYGHQMITVVDGDMGSMDGFEVRAIYLVRG